MEIKSSLKKKSWNKGITLVSLVVTIIVLIILAGISINLTLGEEGIFTLAQKVRENVELTQIEEQKKLNALYMEFDTNEVDTNTEEGEPGDTPVNVVLDFLKFRQAIAKAIIDAGGTSPGDPLTVKEAEPSYTDSIKNIVAEVTKNATAKAEDIAIGKTAWVKGEKITGTNQSGGNSLQVITSFPYTFDKDCDAVICEHYYGINTEDYGHNAAYIKITIKLDSTTLITETDNPTGSMSSGTSSQYKVFHATAGQKLTVSCQSSVVKKGNAAFLVILN